MLLILESVAVCGSDVHARARTALISGYLTANVKDYRPPAVPAQRPRSRKEFEAGLLTLLFDDPELRRWVRDYLIF